MTTTPGGDTPAAHPRIVANGKVGQIDGTLVPRFAGPPTFARLPRGDEVSDWDIALVGIPFDAGVTYRPGARFGPAHVRESSRLLRPYNPAMDISPFARQQVVDAGDLVVNPFDIGTAIDEIYRGSRQLLERARTLVSVGGDHTIALPLLRSLAQRHRSPLAVIHFDAHLDTWEGYFGAQYTHGTPFRRASEEGHIDQRGSIHVGVRGPLYAKSDLESDVELGFTQLHCREMDTIGIVGAIERIRQRVGERPAYISIDIDVLDPAFAPGTGTPEAGGMTSRELLAILRGLADLNIVGADIVEVAPAYDHAQITGVAAAHVLFELVSAIAGKD